MKKIAIVGGGIAGLSSIHYLMKKYNSNDIYLFEKENYLGGRVRTIKWGHHYIDVGAQFLTKEDKEAFRLLRDLNLMERLKKMNMDFYFHDGEKLFSSSLIGLFRNTNIKEKKEVIKLFIKLRKTKKEFNLVPPDDISSEYTSKTFREWYTENVGSQLLRLYDPLLRAMCFTDSSEVSALYGLSIVSALSDQCYSFPNGLSEIIENLRQETKNVNLETNRLVDRIELSKSDINVNGIKFSDVILTIPFSEVKKIMNGFDKVNIDYYSCTYIILSLNKRYLNNGYAIFPPKESPISFISDETLKYNKTKDSRSVLGVIIPDKNERRIRDDKKLINIVIQELNRLIGLSEEDILEYKMYKWDYALPLCSPEFHKSLNKLKTLQLNNIHLCGDYMSLPSLDGAIESARLCVEII